MAPRRRKAGKPTVANLYENDGYFQYKNPQTGQWFGLGRDKRLAMQTAIQANMKLAETAVPLLDRILGGGDRSLGQWLDEYEKILAARLKAKKIAENTHRTLKSYLKRARRTFGLRAPIRSVTTLQIAEAFTAIEEEGKGRTAQGFRSFLLECFREAAVKGWIDSSANPVLITRTEAVEVKRSRLSFDVFMQCYRETDLLWLRNAMALALVSAQARENIVSAQFPQFRDGGWWNIRGKTDAKVVIPLDLRLDCFGMSLGDVLKQCRSTGVLSKHLIHQTQPHGNSPVGAPIHIDTVSRRFGELIGSLGIDWGAKDPPSFHEIRSLSERLYSEQGNVNTQELLTHSSAKMTALYHDSRGLEWIKVTVK